jgi:hypothetical protein
MDTEGPLPHLQEPATFPYTEQSSRRDFYVQKNKGKLFAVAYGLIDIKVS